MLLYSLLLKFASHFWTTNWDTLWQNTGTHIFTHTHTHTHTHEQFKPWLSMFPPLIRNSTGDFIDKQIVYLSHLLTTIKRNTKWGGGGLDKNGNENSPFRFSWQRVHAHTRTPHTQNFYAKLVRVQLCFLYYWWKRDVFLDVATSERRGTLSSQPFWKTVERHRLVIQPSMLFSSSFGNINKHSVAAIVYIILSKGR